MLGEMKSIANNILVTTQKTQKQLRNELGQIFRGDEAGKAITVNVLSFGFKYGIPLDADLVFDVRFLPNPYYIEDLKHHSGLDKCVSDYVLKFEQTRKFVDKLNDMIDFLIPHYIEEGKSQLVIAIGCTGGKHRSVTLAELLYKHLKEKDVSVIVTHRDYQKDVYNKL